MNIKLRIPKTDFYHVFKKSYLNNTYFLQPKALNQQLTNSLQMLLNKYFYNSKV